MGVRSKTVAKKTAARLIPKRKNQDGMLQGEAGGALKGRERT